MKHLREEIGFPTPHWRDYLNIMGKVEALVRKVIAERAHPMRIVKPRAVHALFLHPR